MVWSPLAGGLLSGKYRRDEQGPQGARQLTDWDEPPVRDPDALHDVVDVLVEIAEAAACPPRRSRSRGCSAAPACRPW
jgi:aryl-alcohol dehydrogenase-like predicted oxidoreductase